MDILSNEQIIAMSVAAIAEQTGSDVRDLRVVSFKEIGVSPLQKYLNDHKLNFKKYTLEDEAI